MPAVADVETDSPASNTERENGLVVSNRGTSLKTRKIRVVGRLKSAAHIVSIDAPDATT